jgi:hypothetical protein
METSSYKAANQWRQAKNSETYIDHLKCIFLAPDMVLCENGQMMENVYFFVLFFCS